METRNKDCCVIRDTADTGEVVNIMSSVGKENLPNEIPKMKQKSPMKPAPLIEISQIPTPISVVQITDSTTSENKPKKDTPKTEAAKNVQAILDSQWAKIASNNQNKMQIPSFLPGKSVFENRFKSGVSKARARMMHPTKIDQKEIKSVQKLVDEIKTSRDQNPRIAKNQQKVSAIPKITKRVMYEPPKKLNDAKPIRARSASQCKISHDAVTSRLSVLNHTKIPRPSIATPCKNKSTIKPQTARTFKEDSSISTIQKTVPLNKDNSQVTNQKEVNEFTLANSQCESAKKQRRTREERRKASMAFDSNKKSENIPTNVNTNQTEKLKISEPLVPKIEPQKIIKPKIEAVKPVLSKNYAEKSIQNHIKRVRSNSTLSKEKSQTKIIPRIPSKKDNLKLTEKDKKVNKIAATKYLGELFVKILAKVKPAKPKAKIVDKKMNIFEFYKVQEKAAKLIQKVFRKKFCI